MKKQSFKIFLSFSIFFLPSFFTQESSIQLEPNVSSVVSRYQIFSQSMDLEISGKISYETMSTQELEEIEQAKRVVELPVSVESLQVWFEQYASEYGVSVDLLMSIADCESSFNPSAVNGPYAGMYQYSYSTWTSTRVSMGEAVDAELRFDPQQAIRTTAFKIAAGGAGAWANCL